MLACLDLLERGEAPLDALRSNVAYLVGRLREIGLDIRSECAVVPVPVPAGVSVQRVARSLRDGGVLAAEHPGADGLGPQLLFSVMAAHTQDDLDQAAERVAGAWARFAPAI